MAAPLRHSFDLHIGHAPTSLALLCAGALLGAIGVPAVSAGVLTIRNIPNGARAAATDANSGVSPSITYTHLADLNSDDGGAIVNGVTFPATGGGTVGTFTLTATNLFQNHNSPATDGSGLDDLTDDFFHSGGIGNGAATLTLTGLTPGVPYRLRLYVGGFGGNTTTFSADDTGTVTAVGTHPRNGGDDTIARSTHSSRFPRNLRSAQPTCS